MEFQKTTLENGLTVIGERNNDAKSVAIGYFVNTGSRDETTEVSGVSHFLEHMLFKGSNTISALEINNEFDAMGAKYNAFTSEEVTAYHGAVMPEYQERLLKLLTTMMRPALRFEDFDVEKNVILEEIEMYKDRPEFALFDELRPQYFGSHPLGQSVLGTSESIRDLQRDQMLEYFERRYAPNNITLGVSGNYDWDTTLEQIRALTATWTPAKTGREHPGLKPTPTVRVLETQKFNRAHIAMMCPGFASTDPLRYAAGVLGVIVGDGENSRLYWALVDQGLADSASLDHNAEGGLGHFDGYISADPERAQEVLEIYRGVLQDVQTNGITQAELDRAKRKVAVAMVMRAETPYSRLFALGMEYLESQTYRSLQDSVDLVQGITLAEVQAVLETKPFDSLSIIGLGPISKLV
jgi:predicted Zn-dependent peptidase